MPTTQLSQSLPAPVSDTVCASAASQESCRGLTIHRRTNTNHGLALQMLGHAAEHLNNQIALDNEATHVQATSEAIHLLMQLSHGVFEDYVNATHQRHLVSDWFMSVAIRAYGAA